MNRCRVAVASSAAVALICVVLSFGSTAYAACSSVTHCDTEQCEQLEACDETIDMAKSASGIVAPMSTQKEATSESAIAAAVAETGCREVDICGTTQMVCD